MLTLFRLRCHWGIGEWQGCASLGASLEFTFLSISCTESITFVAAGVKSLHAIPFAPAERVYTARLLLALRQLSKGIMQTLVVLKGSIIVLIATSPLAFFS